MTGPAPHPAGETLTARTIVARVLRIYNRRHGPLFAKGLGFSFVVGGVSLLCLALWVGAYLFHANPSIQRAVSEEILGFLPPGIGWDPIEGILTLSSRWASLGLLTIGVFVFTAFALFDSLERTFASMLRAPRRRFVVGRVVSLVLLGATVLIFYATAALSVLANWFSSAFAPPAASVYLGAKVISLLLTAAVFLALYRLFARRPLRIGRTALVAGIAALCWQLIGTAGAVLIRLAARRFLVYGAVTWAVMIMVYVRVLGEIVVFSSIAVHVVNPRRSTRP